MKVDVQPLLILQKLIPAHRGVFSFNELKNLLMSRTALDAHRQIRSLLQAKVLTRFCRGFYVAQEFDLEWLSQRLCPGSAISMGTILAENLLIGSIPQKAVYAVKVGKSHIYKSPVGQVVQLGFTNRKDVGQLWFGYTNNKFGVCRADIEKAFLDTLYFYQLGRRFSFNVYSDIQVDRLNRKKLKTYLARYKNPKFRAFVKGVLDGYDSE